MNTTTLRMFRAVTRMPTDNNNNNNRWSLVTTAWLSSGCVWRVVPNILNKQSRTSDKGVVLQLGEASYEMSQRASDERGRRRMHIGYW
jgi:hypothetical protein